MDAFTSLVEVHRGELHAHCYRMLGSVHDADDALQETLLGAWRGRNGFEGRSSARTWLFAIATNASLRILRGRGRRGLAVGDPADPRAPLPAPLPASAWIEPYYEEQEAVGLAYVAALQLLPANQRAALLLREVLGFSAREVADMLGTSVPSVNSAVQRARAKLDRERPRPETVAAASDTRELVARFVEAWNQADVEAIVAMLSEDVRFSMPPLPFWLRGRKDVATFLAERVFRSAWRFEATTASGQPAIRAWRDGRLRVLMVLTVDGGRVAAVDNFLRDR